MRRSLFAIAAAVALVPAGCGGPPPLHPVTGKVTLGGKPYERLIIYFRPASGDVTAFNLGVAETDKTGEFKGVKCSAGVGLAAGTYKVTFTCMVRKGTARAVGADEKPDDFGTVVMTELVPPPYDDKTSQPATPQTVTVTAGDNAYTFDIPAK